MWWAIICTRQSRLSFDAEDLQKVLRLKERRIVVGEETYKGSDASEGTPAGLSTQNHELRSYS